jgi:ribonuclease P protein component
MATGVERLRSSATISATLREGTATHRATVVVHALRRPQGPTRAAVVAGRKVGGAVRRNRAKRRLRAALSQLDLPTATDLVVVARAAAVGAPFAELLDDLRSGLPRG